MATWNDKPKSLGAFLDSIRAIRESWKLPIAKELWFRGEPANLDTRLRPKLYRPAAGKPLKDVSELLEIEWDLSEAFQQSAVQLCTALPKDDWDWYFLMQHHGVPTRLLDWSDGALIALHFAVQKCVQGEPHGDSLVYVLDPHWLVTRLKGHLEYSKAIARWKKYVKTTPQDGFSEDEWDRHYLPDDEEGQSDLPLPEIPLLFDVDHTTRRFAAQRSRMVLFGNDPNWLHNVASEPDCRVTSLTVEFPCIPRMRAELRDAGVTESAIFPDLDGLGREMLQLFEERLHQ